MDEYTPYLVIIAFLSVWLLAWVVGTLAFAKLSGWDKLAVHYKQVYPFKGRTFIFQSGLMPNRLFAFRGTLIIGVNSQGLLLRVMPLFNLGHPPLFIPWQDVRSSPSPIWAIRPLVQIEFRECPSVPLHIRRRLVERILEFSEGAASIQGAA